MEISLKKTLRVKKTISTRNLMYIGIYLLFNILCYFQLIGFSYGALALTCVLLVVGVIIRYDEVGIYLFICLAFFNVMNARIQSSSLFYLLCGIVVIRYLLQEREKYHLSSKIILLCIVFLVTGYNLIDAVLRYIKWFILLLTCIMLYHESIIECKIKDIITLFSIAFLMASFWGWLMIQAGMTIDNGGTVYIVSTQYSDLRFAGLVGDSVFYGGTTFILIALNLVVLLANGQNEGLRVSIVAALVLCGILTYSKTFYGGFFIEFALFLWFWLRRKLGKIAAFFISFCIFSLTAVGVFVWITTGTDSAATAMRQRMAADDLSTGRFSAWITYIDLWLHDWTFIFKGIGLSKYATSHRMAVNYAHNILIESVTLFGFLETAAILAVMISAFKQFLRKRAELYWLVPAFMLFMVLGMTSHGHFEYFYYFFVLLVMTVPSAKARELIIASRRCI